MALGTKRLFQNLQLSGHKLYGDSIAGGTLKLVSTPHATKGKIPFGDAGLSAYDEVNDRFGIGTASPSTKLHITSTGSGAAAGDPMILLTGAMNAERAALRSAGFPAIWTVYRSAGTEGTPTAIGTGLVLGDYAFGGFDGSAWQTGAIIRAATAEAWTTSARGVLFSFLTTPIGSTTQTERMRLFDTGNLGVGVSGVFGSIVAATNASTALEVNSTTKAFLHARMTTTQRDALTAVNGMEIYNSTTTQHERYENGAWVGTATYQPKDADLTAVAASGLAGAWTAYTPTWTNLTVGNATQDSAYMQVGKTVFYRIKIVFGTTSSLTTLASASLPVAIKSIGGTALHLTGYGTAYDSSLGGYYTIAHRQDGTFLALGASGTYVQQSGLSTTVPFAAAFATSDEIAIFGSYEAA